MSFVPINAKTAITATTPLGLPPLPGAAANALKRRSRSFGFCLMLLLHLVGLWLVLAPDAPELLPPSAGIEGLTYVQPLALAPPAPLPAPSSKPTAPAAPAAPTPVPQAPTPTVPDPKIPSRRKLPRVLPKLPRPATAKRVENAAIRTPKPPSITSPVPPLVSPPPSQLPADSVVATTPVAPAPDDDFSAHLEAARKRRQTQAQEADQNAAVADASNTAPTSESEAQRADRVARENIAFQQGGQGAQRDQSGGVFQLRSVRLHNAEFMFRGWNTNFKRNTAQLVEVEQGTQADIETAVVKRMIALIRTQKPGKFVWKSIRVGRLVNLDASPEFEKELEQFLLKEFFPDYLPK